MIPKTLHITWCDKNVLEDPNPLIQQGIAQFQRLNPDWQIEISDDHEVNHYLRDNLCNQDWLLLDQSLRFVERCDIWRLIKIYNEGGIYMDIDRLCNVSMTEVLPADVRFVCLINTDWDLSQDLIISAAANPLLREVLDLSLHRRKQGINDVYYLGPQTYLHAMSRMLMGQPLDTDPGEAAMLQLAAAASSMSWITVYREIPPKHTFLYRDAVLDFDFDRAKQQLYANYDIQHWLDPT
jgi:hypothetical protein